MLFIPPVSVYTALVLPKKVLARHGLALVWDTGYYLLQSYPIDRTMQWVNFTR